jgi:O-antigen/teichoic acid export membrane protein
MGERLIKGEFNNFSKIIINRLGGLILTILLARFLQPEYYGYYALVFSIAMTLATFTDLGINGAAVRYLSESLGKNENTKARQYFKFFIKIKSLLAGGLVLVLIFLAKPLSIYIFNTPELTWPIIASAVFILIEQISGLLDQFFYINKETGKTVKRELIYQGLKVGLTLMAIFTIGSFERISGIFLAFSLASLFVAGYAFKYIKKKFPFFFKKDHHNEIDRKRVWKFTSFMSISVLGFIFLGNIDTLMLGVFVSAEYIGFYRAALSLIISLGAIFQFSAILLPEFSKGGIKKIKEILEKVFKYLYLITIPIIFGIIILGKEMIIVLYGAPYIYATIPLIILSPLIILHPIKDTLIAFFGGIEKSKITAKIIIGISLLNIILNFILIKYLSTIDAAYGAWGAAIATTISYLIMVVFLIKYTKKETKKIQGIFRKIIKPIIAGAFMTTVIILSIQIFPLEGFQKIWTIPLGIISYGGAILFIKAISIKEIKDILKGIR